MPLALDMQQQRDCLFNKKMACIEIPQSRHQKNNTTTNPHSILSLFHVLSILYFSKLSCSCPLSLSLSSSSHSLSSLSLLPALYSTFCHPFYFFFCLLAKLLVRSKTMAPVQGERREEETGEARREERH